MTLDELCAKSKRKVAESKTPMTIAAAVSGLLEGKTNAELIEFLKSECYYDIRNYLEEQIIGAAVNKIRYDDSIKTRR